MVGEKPMSTKIRKGDTVIVVTGREEDKEKKVRLSKF